MDLAARFLPERVTCVPHDAKLRRAWAKLPKAEQDEAVTAPLLDKASAPSDAPEKPLTLREKFKEKSMKNQQKNHCKSRENKTEMTKKSTRNSTKINIKKT